jgi:predicted dehydrogenase
VTRALIVGFGSIGQRHAAVLADIGCEVSVVSRRLIQEYVCHSSIGDALGAERIEYVVIANETSAHAQAFTELVHAGFTGKLLVEKPLGFRRASRLEDKFALAALGYNLRFHPVLSAMSRALKAQNIISMQVYCGQYLPSWRPAADYRSSYSADAKMGGGVLRDLSHELDYMLWLAGGCVSVAALGGQLGQLEINSDDCWGMLMKFERCPVATLQINYFDRPGSREIIVQTADHSFHADLVNATFARDGVIEKFNVNRNDTYVAQHKAILAGDGSCLCSLDQGDNVMSLIEAAETAARSNTWVSL